MKKSIYLLVLPTVGAVLFLLDLIFDFPVVDRLLGIILMLILIVGVLEYLEPNQHDGRLVMTEKEDGGYIFSLELDEDPSEFEFRESISFKVEK